VENKLEDLADVLASDLLSRRIKILELLSATATAMPDKTSIYTTLLGLMNAKSYNFGGTVVEKLVANLKTALKTCDFVNARYLVRFLVDLVNANVIVPASAMALFESFVSVTLETDIPQVRSDWYVYAVVSAIPWVGAILSEKKGLEFDKLLDTIDQYMR
jgi:nuclear cap-binding protein subunit 1